MKSSMTFQIDGRIDQPSMMLNGQCPSPLLLFHIHFIMSPTSMRFIPFLLKTLCPHTHLIASVQSFPYKKNLEPNLTVSPSSPSPAIILHNLKVLMCDSSNARAFRFLNFLTSNDLHFISVIYSNSHTLAFQRILTLLYICKHKFRHSCVCARICVETCILMNFATD